LRKIGDLEQQLSTTKVELAVKSAELLVDMSLSRLMLSTKVMRTPRNAEGRHLPLRARRLILNGTFSRNLARKKKKPWGSCHLRTRRSWRRGINCWSSMAVSKKRPNLERKQPVSLKNLSHGNKEEDVGACWSKTGLE
jgi:hypothetical protein